VMTIPRELTPSECAALIVSGGVGRLAVCTTDGPAIYPLNFTVDGHSIVFRTSPYSALGAIGWGMDVAFEVDQLDWATRRGWSVVLKGRADVVDDPAEVERLRELGKEPDPWAQGVRRQYIRVPWTQITGRAVGTEWLGSSPPAAMTQFV
jgi:nitroimidazol reductase NimA-like FMN-containing flavoprotein (pyridoxamine 5'-phosphate oxidase superfamily)